MARLASFVVPGIHYPVTQRGHGRARTVFGDKNNGVYRDLLAETFAAAEVGAWAWMLTHICHQTG